MQSGHTQRLGLQVILLMQDCHWVEFMQLLVRSCHSLVRSMGQRERVNTRLAWSCRSSVLLALFLAFSLCRLSPDLFIVLFQGSQILASLRELALLHALTHIPSQQRWGERVSSC